LFFGEEFMNSIGRSAAVAAAVMLAGTTWASAQANHFRGNACVQTATAACAAVGVNVGMCYDARLRPNNFNGQANSTRLSLFLGMWAMNFTLPVGSLVGAAFKPVKASAIGQSLSQYNATARIAAIAPAPAAATVFVNATIDINGFDVDAAACNVRLRFQGQRFPLP
jgi:hypothetical protein